MLYHQSYVTHFASLHDRPLIVLVAHITIRPDARLSLRSPLHLSFALTLPQKHRPDTAGIIPVALHLGGRQRSEHGVRGRAPIFRRIRSRTAFAEEIIRVSAHICIRALHLHVNACVTTGL